VKIIAVVAAIVAIALLPPGAFVALAIAFVGLVVASASARLGPFRLARTSFVAAPFILAALPIVFLRPGDTLAVVPIGPLTVAISADGLRTFATIAGKSWLSVQAALLLTYTTPFHDLVDALRKLHLPEVMVAIVGFMVRYLGVLNEEASRLLRARTSRSASVPGVPRGGSLRWRAGVTGGMVGSLFIRSYERSERIHAAMQARGYAGTFRHLHGRAIHRNEWIALALLVLAMFGFVIAGQLWLPRL
jgi:cobalt/nickel transport system permease protein